VALRARVVTRPTSSKLVGPPRLSDFRLDGYRDDVERPVEVADVALASELCAFGTWREGEAAKENVLRWDRRG
jgi:hypothetical protein